MNGGRGPRAWRTDLLGAIALGAAYYLAAQLSLQLALVGENITPLWPPTGIALVGFLLRGRRLWPGVAIAAFAVNLTISATPLAAATTAAGNTLAPLAAAILLDRVGFRPQLDRLRDALAIVFLAALASMLISATIGATTLLASGVIEGSEFLGAWSVWWAGDAMGILVVAPFLLTITTIREHPVPQRMEAGRGGRARRRGDRHLLARRRHRPAHHLPAVPDPGVGRLALPAAGRCAGRAARIALRDLGRGGRARALRRPVPVRSDVHAAGVQRLRRVHVVLLRHRRGRTGTRPSRPRGGGRRARGAGHPANDGALGGTRPPGGGAGARASRLLGLGRRHRRGPLVGRDVPDARHPAGGGDRRSNERSSSRFRRIELGSRRTSPAPSRKTAARSRTSSTASSARTGSRGC